MKSESSFQWSAWISLVLLGLLQICVIYASLFRYIMLKNYVFNSYYGHLVEHEWIFYILNFELFVIIVALGILPLWFYSIIFSVSSFFCKGFSPQLNRRGFHELVLKESVDIFNQQKLEVSNSLHQSNSRNCSCQNTIKFGTFYPIASIFQVFIAYSLLLPIPFVDIWFTQIEDKNKKIPSTNELDFSIKSSIITKINWSMEYVNFIISLGVFCLQYPNLIWSANKMFSVVFSLLEFLIVIHISIDFPIISMVIKNSFKNCTICENGSKGILIYTAFLLASSIIGNLFLLLTFYPVFQFAYEKCVQSLLKSAWFFNNYRMDTCSTNNIDQFPCQSNTSNSMLYSPDKIRDIRTNLYSFFCAALFLFGGIGVKCFTYYHFQEFWNHSQIFIVYFIQSSIFIGVYLMFWFGISLKPKWSFSIKDFEKKKILPTSTIPKEESNYYKSQKSNLKTSQISLSSASNTNLSIQSIPSQPLHNRIDFTNPYVYLNRCGSLKLAFENKENQDFTDYLQLSQHLPQARIYKTIQPSITSPRPFIDDRDKKMIHNNYYKCSNSNSIIRNSENIRNEDPYQIIKKSNMEFSIQEETSNENISSISDDFSSNLTSSPNNDTTNKNNTNMKFVTFRLDNNTEINTGLSTSTSNESLTVITLEQSEAFLKELEGVGSDKFNFNNFRKEINQDFRDKFILPIHSEADSLPMISQAKASLL